MKKDSPKFRPGQYVTVAYFGLNYPGRITKMELYPGNLWKCVVDYAQEGTLKTGTFEEDELRKV